MNKQTELNKRPFALLVSTWSGHKIDVFTKTSKIGVTSYYCRGLGGKIIASCTSLEGLCVAMNERASEVRGTKRGGYLVK